MKSKLVAKTPPENRVSIMGLTYMEIGKEYPLTVMIVKARVIYSKNRKMDS
jgi:hypothetical protein